MIAASLMLIFSGALLVFSSDLLINQTKELAYRLKLSKLFIALVLMSLGTSLPELTVSSVALMRSDPGLAVGGLVGSNITNITLILGMAILVNNFRVGTSKTQKNAWLLLFVTGLFILLYWLPVPVTTIGSLLIGVAVGSIIWEYVMAVRGRKHEDHKFILQFPQHHIPTWQLVAKTLVALAILIVSGTLLVITVEFLSETLGLTTTVLGLTLAALATSLPELVSTIIAQAEHEEKIAMGNILGSNIYNLVFIGGLMTFNLPYNIKLGFESGILAATTLIFFFIIKYWKGRHVSKFMGITLLFSYIFYLFITLVL